ncbi:MAG: diacylglycerol kinase family lipid kinase [Bacteroidales bacterium]|nr:diacylglycerol kinase family lipid kinase [Bacteroidales bacterium]
MKNELFFIINPNAGSNHDGKWTEIFAYLDAKNVKHNHYLTKSKNDAIFKMSKFLSEGYRKFIVVGGDGTTNEVINGIFRQKDVPYSEIAVGSIPLGTANDWNRNYGWENDIISSLDRIIKMNITQQDVGAVSFNKYGQNVTRYFINSIGFGFDAEIVKMTNSMTVRNKEHEYLFSLFKCLLKSKKINVKIDSGDFHYKGKVLSISIAIGKYSGGGMQQTPHAINNDGLFDISIFGDISKFTVVRYVNTLFNGTVTEVKNKNLTFTRISDKVTLEVATPTLAEIDGELIGDGPYEISIIKNGLNVIN